MDFKEAFGFPIKHAIVGALGTKHNKVFDFTPSWLYPNCYKITEDSEKKVIDILNGNSIPLKMKIDLSYMDGMVYINHDGVIKEFILIRGWGHLTGSGGLNLKPEVAAKLQDDLGNYIVETLSNINVL